MSATKNQEFLCASRNIYIFLVGPVDILKDSLFLIKMWLVFCDVMSGER